MRRFGLVFVVVLATQLSAQVAPKQYDILQYSFTATTFGVNPTYLQDLTTFTMTWTAPGGSCLRGDGVAVTSFTVLGYLHSNVGAAATWKANISLPCPGLWTYTSTATAGSNSWNAGTNPATPHGALSVAPSSADGFLRISGRRFVRERTGTAIPLVGAAQDPTTRQLWSIGGAGGGGSDVDGAGTDGQYFGALGDKFNLFRNTMWSASQKEVSSFNDDGAGHNKYDTAKSALWDGSLRAMRANAIHYMRTFENAAGSGWATSGANYTAVRNGVRYAIGRYAALVDLWEIVNENDSIKQPFITAIGAYIRSVDGYRHPITTSYTPGTATPAGLTGLDFTSPHYYVRTSGTRFYTDAEELIDANHSAYTTPVLMGEAGLAYPLQNSDSAPYRLLGFAALGFIKGAGMILWDRSDYHPTAVSQGQNSNVYIGIAERATIRHLVAHWDKLNATSVPPGNIASSAGLLCRGADSTSGNADKIGFCADQTGFFAVHKTGTVTTTFQTTGMTISWMDPITGTILATSTPGKGQQIVTIPPFIGSIIWRACVHGAPGCPL
jgi:hypothetical protein